MEFFEIIKWLSVSGVSILITVFTVKHYLMKAIKEAVAATPSTKDDEAVQRLDDKLNEVQTFLENLLNTKFTNFEEMVTADMKLYVDAMQAESQFTRQQVIAQVEEMKANLPAKRTRAKRTTTKKSEGDA